MVNSRSYTVESNETSCLLSSVLVFRNFFIMKAKVQQRCLNKKATLVEYERRFKRACEQIMQLYCSLNAPQKDATRLKRTMTGHFRYSLSLRIAVVDGMRNMHYDNAHKKAEAVAEPRQAQESRGCF